MAEEKLKQNDADVSIFQEMKQEVEKQENKVKRKPGRPKLEKSKAALSRKSSNSESIVNIKFLGS